MPTPCTKRAAGPRRRRASARPSKCSRSGSPTTHCSTRCQAFGIATCSSPPPERAAWQICLGGAGYQPAPVGNLPTGTEGGVLSQSSSHPAASAFPIASGGPPDATGRLPVLPLLESCRSVSQRAATALEIVLNGSRNLLDIGLDHLTLGRAALYEAILESGRRRGNESQTPPPAESQRLLTSSPTTETARCELDAAVASLRRAGQVQELPRALLTRAWLRFLTGACIGPESAQADLDEAWEIAERGPMRLFMADIHLYRARLFGSPTADGKWPNYPWESPEADLKAAEELIHKCGYHRRDDELADAKKAILGWS